MSVPRPTPDDVRRIATAYHFSLSDDEVTTFGALVDATLESYDRLDELVEPIPPVRYPRERGQRPAGSGNPLGAWYYRSTIRGADSGVLAGKTVAIKDNICVAGVPMMNGTAVLEGYVPDADATVVERVLDAGGTILGKAVCESLCFSGGSHTSDTGPVRNPYDTSRSTGGSSSGCAALVATGAVDVAIGGDQGGSVRIPSGWCGIYGLKPSHGLVPIRRVCDLKEFTAVEADLRGWVSAWSWTSGDGPKAIFIDAAGWLRERDVLLPGVSTLTRLVAQVRDDTTRRLWAVLDGLLTVGQRYVLDQLLEVPPGPRISDLERWRKGPPPRGSGPTMIKAPDQVADVMGLGMGDLGAEDLVPPRRLSELAKYGMSADASLIRRHPEGRRMATLLATVRLLEAKSVDDTWSCWTC